MTRPRWKRNGFARGLLVECLGVLAERGWDEIGLIVTEGNAPAESLYRSLGFEPESP